MYHMLKIRSKSEKTNCSTKNLEKYLTKSKTFFRRMMLYMHTRMSFPSSLEFSVVASHFFEELKEKLYLQRNV